LPLFTTPSRLCPHTRAADEASAALYMALLHHLRCAFPGALPKRTALSPCLSYIFVSAPPTLFGRFSLFFTLVQPLLVFQDASYRPPDGNWSTVLYSFSHERQKLNGVSQLKLCIIQFVTDDPKNRWIRYTCANRRVRRKCFWCTMRRYSSVAAEALRYHLRQQ